ncbi:MAG: type II toxin-antitoxin system RelE/ParE family toxin [Anaerolineales bacterium]|nr:type II toxin-antitoxin system RelE/ParE family toxin [Anaerolineales bacterium]
MQINIRNTAIKDLKKIDKQNKQRIHAKILELEQFPNISNVKRLTNFEPAYRIRVGDYRILFDVFENHIEIGRVLHRKESYSE